MGKERAGEVHLCHRKIAGDAEEPAVWQDHGGRDQAERSPCGGLCSSQGDDVQGSGRCPSPPDWSDEIIPGGLAKGRKGKSGDLLS